MVVLNTSYLLVLLLCAGGVLSTPLCLTGDFDSQLQHILHTQVDYAQDPELIVSRVLDDVRATLSQRWQGFKLFPFGSLTSGVGTKSSDLDITLHLPNFNYSSALDVIEETRQLFQKQPDLYIHVDGIHMPRYTLYSFIYIPTQQKVDLIFHLFTSGEEVIATSKLLKYYFSLDKRNLTLVRFLKYLFSIHGLTSSGPVDTLISYTVYLLLIFYLQQKNMAPPVYVLQKDTESVFFRNWDVSFNELPYNTTNTENLHQLLGGFFKYYSEFNFEENIVSPYTGRPIPKSALVDVENLPKEHFLNNFFNRTILRKISNGLNCTELCIQAPFHLSVNKGERVSHEYAIKFKYFVKSVARLFADLPSESVLRAILLVERQETVTNLNNSTGDVMNQENCIEV
ncbi:hypothetical protein PYW07_004746 [Mythimna separata]|uniref:PAP-associated domain-containing protein n=1 Tax=Mythimna separata TaxID=271217 RepID=A0AAD7YZ16_MYTSE|nr:hypothetical protein PYW07_004746 [Mythimna separata]